MEVKEISFILLPSFPSWNSNHCLCQLQAKRHSAPADKQPSGFAVMHKINDSEHLCEWKRWKCTQVVYFFRKNQGTYPRKILKSVPFPSVSLWTQPQYNISFAYGFEWLLILERLLCNIIKGRLGWCNKKEAVFMMFMQSNKSLCIVKAEEQDPCESLGLPICQLWGWHRLPAPAEMGAKVGGKEGGAGLGWQHQVLHTCTCPAPRGPGQI